MCAFHAAVAHQMSDDEPGVGGEVGVAFDKAGGRPSPEQSLKALLDLSLLRWER